MVVEMEKKWLELLFYIFVHVFEFFSLFFLLDLILPSPSLESRKLVSGVSSS